MDKYKYQQCKQCDKNTSMYCSKCQQVYYCSKECQKTDWNEHKHICGKNIQSDINNNQSVDVNNIHIEGNMRLQQNIQKAHELYGDEIDCEIIYTEYFALTYLDNPDKTKYQTIYQTLVCKENHELVLGKPRFEVTFKYCRVKLIPSFLFGYHTKIISYNN